MILEFKIIDKRKKNFVFKQKIHSRSHKNLIIIMIIYVIVMILALSFIYNLINSNIIHEQYIFWMILGSFSIVGFVLIFLFFFGDAKYDNDLAIRLQERLIIQNGMLEYVYSVFTVNGEEVKNICIANLSNTVVTYMKKQNVLLFSGDTRAESYKDYDISKAVPINQMNVANFVIPAYFEDSLFIQLRSLCQFNEIN